MGRRLGEKCRQLSLHDGSAVRFSDDEGITLLLQELRRQKEWKTGRPSNDHCELHIGRAGDQEVQKDTLKGYDGHQDEDPKCC